MTRYTITITDLELAAAKVATRALYRELLLEDVQEDFAKALKSLMDKLGMEMLDD